MREELESLLERESWLLEVSHDLNYPAYHGRLLAVGSLPDSQTVSVCECVCMHICVCVCVCVCMYVC